MTFDVSRIIGVKQRTTETDNLVYWDIKVQIVRMWNAIFQIWDGFQVISFSGIQTISSGRVDYYLRTI
jgi:hypothetical protein